MQLNNNTIKVDSNGNINSQQFGIADMSIIIEVLTKLYGNPIQTLTQEYLCNARDSHRESKQSKPIDITLPTKLNPVLSIRDYGVGLSLERITQVFMNYGASTKRATNTQTGGFGIGAKSAWAYTDSFTVTSWHNAIKRVYVCHRSNGNGHGDLIEEIKSNEPNGVQVDIPVNTYDIIHFNNAVQRAVKYWKKSERPNCLNGTLTFFDELCQFNNMYINRNDYNADLIIIDGIPYPLPNIYKQCRAFNELKNKFTSQFQTILFIDNGIVSIAPNRESLIDNDTTKAALNSAYQKIDNAVQKIVNDHLKSITNISNVTKLTDKTNGLIKISGKIGNWRYNQTKLTHKDLFEYDVIDYKKQGNPTLEKLDQTTYDISTSFLNRIYFDDTGESALKVNKRLRVLLDKHNDRVVLIKDRKMADELNAVMLSTIPIPPPIPKIKGVKPFRKNKIFISVKKSYYYSRQWITVEDNATLYVYVEKSKQGSYHSEVYRFLQNRHFNIAIVADSNVKKLNNKFTHIDDCIKTIELTDGEIDTILNTKLCNKFGKAKQLSSKLNSKQLNRISQVLVIKKTNNVPDILEHKVYSSKRFKKFMRENYKLKQFFIDNPLLNAINIFELCQKSINDLNMYIRRNER